MIDSRNLRTIRQLAEERPAFTVSSLKYMVRNAANTGFDQCIVRIGRKLLIDTDALDEWIEEQQYVE